MKGDFLVSRTRCDPFELVGHIVKIHWTTGLTREHEILVDIR